MASDNLITNLLTVPKRDKGVNMPHYRQYPKNYIHQADLLFLPNDNGYKYALVVVDIGSRMVDAEKLKKKTVSEVIKAFEKIYKRKILKYPNRIETDSGSEFKSTFKDWASGHNIKVKTAKPHRHRQVALVERRNQMIGTKLFYRMTEQEILTGETSRQWVYDLPIVIKEINKRTKKNRRKRKPKDEPVCKGDTCSLLTQGTKVRVALEVPKDVATGKRLHGKFRSTDIRWDRTPRIIMETIIQPDMPPLYLLNDGTNVDRSAAYTKNQLQVIPKKEKLPQSKSIRPVKGADFYIVDKLISRKKIKGKWHLKVRWKGYDASSDSWEKRSELMKSIPDMVKIFEQKLKR